MICSICGKEHAPTSTAPTSTAPTATAEAEPSPAEVMRERDVAQLGNVPVPTHPHHHQHGLHIPVPKSFAGFCTCGQADSL